MPNIIPTRYCYIVIIHAIMTIYVDNSKLQNHNIYLSYEYNVNILCAYILNLHTHNQVCINGLDVNMKYENF